MTYAERWDFWERQRGVQEIETLQVHSSRLAELVRITTLSGNKSVPDRVHFKAAVMFPINMGIQIYEAQKIEIMYD